MRERPSNVPPPALGIGPSAGVDERREDCGVVQADTGPQAHKPSIQHPATSMSKRRPQRPTAATSDVPTSDEQSPVQTCGKRSNEQSRAALCHSRRLQVFLFVSFFFSLMVLCVLVH